MAYKIKSGDTLRKIAKTHGIPLAKLLEANPRFKTNPNMIRVGDVLKIPNGKPPPVIQPLPIRPHPPVAGRTLGKLSERFETGGRGPGTVSTGKGDRGGVSYGSYQMTSKPSGGTVKRFVSQPDFPFRQSFVGLTPGSDQFTAAWKEIANAQAEEFRRSQHDFIKRTHFEPLVQKILREDGLNVLSRSHALQDVIWSTAVQHGPGNTIPHDAIRRLKIQPEDPHFDEKLITAIYVERGRKKGNGALVYFSGNSTSVQKGVAQRFKAELHSALTLLAQETVS